MKIQITAHPNSKKPRVEKDKEGVLHIYITESAIEGRANKAVIKALSAHFGVKNNQVLLLSGEKSKRKLVEII